MNELISVVITTYKRPYGTLLRAVQSVLSQTYTTFELIIVDDSPADYCDRESIRQSILELNDQRIVYIQHEVNKGACAARNTGIQHASGRYIAFLDDDDEWLPKKLELQYKRMTETKADLVYAGSRTIYESHGQVRKVAIRNATTTGYVFDLLMIENFIGSTSFVLVRKEALLRSGNFNERIKSAQDYELWLRIAKNGLVEAVNEPLVNYYVHEDERISTNLDSRIHGKEMILELYDDYLAEHPKVKAIKLHKLLRYYQVKYGRRYALGKWCEAFRTYPWNLIGLKSLIRIVLPNQKKLDP